MSGWNLPPGVFYRDIDPPIDPCELCGEEDCECPECPVCETYGDKRCYEDDGHMEMTKEQVMLWFSVQREWLLQARADAEYWDQYGDWDELA